MAKFDELKTEQPDTVVEFLIELAQTFDDFAQKGDGEDRVRYRRQAYHRRQEAREYLQTGEPTRFMRDVKDSWDHLGDGIEYGETL